MILEFAIEGDVEQRHVMDLSILAGAPIFYAVSRSIARSCPNALALFGFFW